MEKKQKIMLYSGILVFILITDVFFSVYPFSTVDIRDEYISSVTYNKGWEKLTSKPLSSTHVDDGNHYSMMGSNGIDANLLFVPSLGGRDMYISMRASGSDRIAPAPITLEINGGIITIANVIDFDNVIYNSVDSIELIMGDESGNEYIALYYFRIVEIETAPPPTPEAPDLSLIVPNPSVDGIITLHWSVSTLATSYQVFVSGVLIDTTTETTYTDEITINGIYEYMIRAENEYGVSEFSNIESVMVDIQEEDDEFVPDAPILSPLTYVVEDGETEIYLNWSVVDCDSYNVYKSVDGGSYILIQDNLILTTYSEVLTEAGVHSYKITAENIYGESELSNLAFITITEEGELIEPTDYTVLYVLFGVFGALVVITIILVKKKKSRSLNVVENAT